MWSPPHRVDRPRRQLFRRTSVGNDHRQGPGLRQGDLMIRSSFRDRPVLCRASRSTVSRGRFDVRSRPEAVGRDAGCRDGPTPHRPLVSTNALRGPCVTLCAGSGRPVTARRGTPTAQACPGSPSSTRSPIRTGRSTSGRTGGTRSPTSAASHPADRAGLHLDGTARLHGPQGDPLGVGHRVAGRGDPRRARVHSRAAVNNRAVGYNPWPTVVTLGPPDR
jgi:hypothetical protein